MTPTSNGKVYDWNTYTGGPWLWSRVAKTHFNLITCTLILLLTIRDQQKLNRLNLKSLICSTLSFYQAAYIFALSATPTTPAHTVQLGRCKIVNRPRKEGPVKNVMLQSHDTTVKLCLCIKLRTFSTRYPAQWNFDWENSHTVDIEEYRYKK